jgi:hypothetical protein
MAPAVDDIQVALRRQPNLRNSTSRLSIPAVVMDDTTPNPTDGAVTKRSRSPTPSDEESRTKKARVVAELEVYNSQPIETGSSLLKPTKGLYTELYDQILNYVSLSTSSQTEHALTMFV